MKVLTPQIPGSNSKGISRSRDWGNGLNLPKRSQPSTLLGMNMKTAGIVMAVIAALMILMGLGLLAIPNINAPIVSGVGFLVVAYMFYTHKH